MMRKVTKTIRLRHCLSKMAVALGVLEMLGALAWAAVVVEQGRCSRKIVPDSWAARRHNSSGTNRQRQLD